MVTFGFVYILTNVVLWIWGAHPIIFDEPSLLAGSIPIGEMTFPVYRIAVIFMGAASCLGLWWIQAKTKVGAIVRAGMDDAEMVSGLGVNLAPIATGIFCLGAGAAGFAGFVGIPVIGALVFDYGWGMLVTILVVCIVGGVGSISGALVGALIIGTIDTYGMAYYPDLAPFTKYLTLVIILMLVPTGLLGRRT
jgi:branched-chain amino acid transport system permease protein